MQPKCAGFYVLRLLVVCATLLIDVDRLLAEELDGDVVVDNPTVQHKTPRPYVNQTRVENFWQPRDKHLAFTALGTAQITNRDIDDATGARTATTNVVLTTFDPTIAIALSDQWAVTLRVGNYQDNEANTLTNAGVQTSLYSFGFTEPSATVEGTFALGRSRLFTGSAFTINIGNQAQTTATQSGNRTSGGPAIVPYLGYAFDLTRKDFIGGRVTYDYVGQRVVVNQAATTTVTDGGDATLLATFYEHHGRHYYFGPVVTYSMTDAANVSTNGKNSNVDPNVSLAVNFIAGIYFTPSVLFLLEYLNTETYSYRNGANRVPYFWSTTYEAGLRIEF